MRYKIFDVFSQTAFEGNPTGIVYYDGPADRGLMQRIAAEMPVPDTIFLTPPSGPEELFSSLAFSPCEELPICGQGLIAAMFSLMDDGELSPGVHRVGTALGTTRAFVEPATKTPVSVSLGIPTISTVGQPEWADVVKLLKLDLHGDSSRAVVDLGRRRLVVEVPPECLKELHLDSSSVMAACGAMGVTGLVFCARETEHSGHARARFFATSLNGREDMAGGAAGAALAFYRDRGLLTGSSSLMVHLGGIVTRRGYVFARFEDASREILVGGSAVKALEGRLRLGT